MDLFQMVAAGVIIMLAVLAGACLAALWHSSSRSANREQSPTPLRRAEPHGKRGSSPAKPVGSSVRPAPSAAAGRKEVAQGLADRVAQWDRLKQDRPRIQAAIMEGDGRALFDLAAEYKKLGFEHAAHELFEKARWLGSSGQPADRAASSQERGGATKTESSARAPGERRAL